MTGSNGSVVRACENMVTNTGTRVSIGGRRVTRSVQSDIECQQGRQCTAKAVAADGYARRGSRIEITLDRVLRRQCATYPLISRPLRARARDRKPVILQPITRARPGIGGSERTAG